MKRIFICEICETPLGTIEFETLGVPMLPEMFGSLDPGSGIPAPFQPFLEQNMWRCRQCTHCPFKTPDHVTYLDEKGFNQQIDINKLQIENKTREANQAAIIEIFGEETVERPTPVSMFQDSIVEFFKRKREAKEPEGFTCGKCGKPYKHQSSLARHKAVCDG